MMSFQEVASAAGVAAEKALEAATLLASYGSKQMPAASFDKSSRNSSRKSSLPHSQSEDHRTIKRDGDGYEYFSQENKEMADDDRNRKVVRRQSYNCQRATTNFTFDESDCDEEIEMEEPPREKTGKFNRRHSYNVPPPHSNVRYDEYDDEEEEDEEEEDSVDARGKTNGAPQRPAPQIPARRVHPKLPDYDSIAARFEALKQHKARPR